MRILIFYISLLLIFFSCEKKNDIIFEEKTIKSSTLVLPKERMYVELIDYYPAVSKNQSNFYIVKNIHNNDTIFVVDINNLPVYDFIKNYEGVNNSTITLEKGNYVNKKKEYIIRIPVKYNKINSKKTYLGELINLVD